MSNRHKKAVGLVRAALVICLLGIPITCLAQVFYDNEYTWSNSDPTLNVRRSDHFRFIWGNGQNPDTSSEYSSMTEALVQGGMQAYEHAYHQIFDAAPGGVGFRPPNESTNPAYRDGRYYRTNMTYNNTGIYAGGGWGTMDSYGFPWLAVNPAGMRYDPQPDASFHEYIHAVLINCQGFNNTPWDGEWHESTDDWLDDQTYFYAGMGNYGTWHNLSLTNGRCYYDSYLFDELLYEDPALGTPFIVNLWTQANGGSGEYMFDAMARLWPPSLPDAYNQIKDRLGKMAARNVTWDYWGKQYYRTTTTYTIDGSPFNDMCRRGTTELIAQPGNPGWYRVPFDHAACQGGYNIIPIQLTGKSGGGYSVSVNFQPLWDAARKSDWRACFVAVNNNGDARYSSIWNSGTNTIVLSADENKLFLTVAATPDFLPFCGANGPLMTDAPTSPQPYRLQMVNTSATPYLIVPTGGGTGWHQHSNGGGWVKDSATVDSTAYVGPNALVFDTAQVRGNARIEDYAQILTTAQVRDNAIVSGHAVVKDQAQVYGYAKVRDWATVSSHATVYENGKVLEHGYVGDTVQVHGSAIVKGCAMDFGTANNSGCAIKDADCSNYADITKGVLMGWVWGSNPDRVTALADNAYLYCGYNFDTYSPNYALDRYGITYGYLMGGPSIADGGATNRHSVLSLDGTSQYIELPNGTSDFDDCTFAVWVKWNGGAAEQKVFSFGDGANKYITLTPSSTSGNLKFAITTTGSGGEQTLTSTAVPTGTWTHIAVTISGNTGTLYVNGTPVATNASMSINPDDCNGANVASAGNCNYVGRGNSGNYFSGQIDEFRIYNKALTGTDITALQSLAGGTYTPVADTTAPTPNAATWLVSPAAADAKTITMAATRGTDASNYIEYYFTCTAGGGHDSGWISNNKYFDCGLTPGTMYTYTVKMRDKAGNMTTASSPASVTLPTDSAAPTPTTATFLTLPKGISTTAIKMTATVGTDASALVEYKFSRTAPTTADSGWQSTNMWTDAGLTSGLTYTYTVQMRDAYGNTGTVSAPATAMARDDTPPTRYTLGEWTTFPYGTIDNKISMRARSVNGSDILSCNIANETVQYYFHCTSGGGPDSGWQSSNLYTTTALADGTYSYQFKIKDSLGNETPYSSIQTGSITATTGYHTCTFAQVTTLPDENLVSFNCVPVQSNFDNYLVKDPGSNATVTVKPAAFAPTDPSKLLKIVRVDGHLRTLSGTRIVDFATVTPILDAPLFAVSGRVTGAGGVGVANATVYFSATADASVNATCTTTTDVNGNYSKSMPNGQWYVAASAPNYYTSSDQTPAVNGSPVTNVNISLTSAYTITASAGAGGSITPSGAVLVSSGANQSFTITALSGYSIGDVLVDGVSVGSVSSYAFNAVSANHTISATFTANNRNIPQQASLIDSAVTDTFPASGSTGNWASFMPTSKTYTTMASPTVDMINNAKWDRNLYADGDGYDCGDHGSTSIPCNGASIVTVIKPIRNSTSSPFNSIVDVFYDRLVLGIMNNTGSIIVRRNGTQVNTGQVIPDGQVTVLSLVCQSNGNYKVYANGTQVYSNTTTSTMTSLVPGVAGAYATHINVGRNNPDTWSTFNGDIGDFFLYSIALSDADRQTLEADLTAKFASGTSRTITASAGTGGTISPTGAVSVPNGGGATFAITPDLGYAVSQVTVDSVNQGAITSYTFSNVTANHTISATFTTTTTHTITASAGTGGSISPSGAVLVNHGTNKTFTITPSVGYAVSQVTVDGVNQGAITSYTFTNVTANHTISATFTQQVCAITASAATGGTISPSGNVNVNYGANQTFTITPTGGNAVSSVMVDGVDVGPVTSYTFSAVTTTHTISAIFIAGTRNIPRADLLHFSLDTKDIPGSGSITSWPWLWPTGSTLTNVGTPTAITDGAKWEQNFYADAEGFRVGRYSTPIAANGTTIVCAVKPIRSADTGNWRSVVDVMYGEVVLGVHNNTGMPQVRLKKSMYTGTTAIPDGQKTVMSLVVQPSGAFTVYANGAIVQTGSGGALTQWIPGNTTGDPVNGYDTYINVGRSNPDSWSTFNGQIGDVFLYKGVLADDERQRLEADMITKFLGLSYTITASAGTGGTITPSGGVVVGYGGSQTFSITPNGNYSISNVVIDGISVGVAASYTFTNVTGNHTISATFAATGNFTITASAGTGGTISPIGAVVVSPGANQTFTITPNTGYGISSVTVDSVNQGSINTYTFTNVQANHTISAAFTALGRNVPKSDQLLFSAVTDSFPSSGSTGNWATFWPTGGTLTMMATPVVDTIGGVKWEQNLRADLDGYVLGNYSSAIAVNGATVIAVAKPIRYGGPEAWTSIVDIFYDRVVLGIRDDTGIVCVKRNINTNNTTDNSATAIPDGQLTVLSLVVQPDSSYKVYANGTQIMNVAGTGATVSWLNPDHTDTMGTDYAYTHYINVGRSNPDGWSTFNGDIGDVFVYKAALSDADRQTLEDDLISKFGIGTYTITASAGTGGTITPSGVVAVNAGTSQTFNIAANAGYAVSQVTVDGVNQGAITSYTFTNVIANHTISATFAASTYTITASAGGGGTIAPSGAVVVSPGANQTFTITPNTGYIVASVTVDGVNVGGLRTYTFTNVQANHTISVAFTASTDLMAYWKFDETSGTTGYDSTTYARNATLSGSCSWATGLTNNAVSIPGGTSYVGLPSGIVSGLTNWTVVTWVKLTTVSTNMRIFDFGSSTTNYLSLTPKHANSSGKVQFYIRNTAGTAFYVRGTAALPTGSWQHVAVTQSGNTVTLYVQGAQVGQITNCTLNPNSLGTLTNNKIGDSQTSSHPHLNGLIDGFRIYNRALTGTEITSLYGGGFGPASVDDEEDSGWIIIPAK